MDYFDDLNPYLVKEDDNENLTRQQTVQIGRASCRERV